MRFKWCLQFNSTSKGNWKALSTLDPQIILHDFENAGKAIYDKMQNDLTEPDPAFVNMKKLQQLTGSTSVSQSAEEVQKLLNKIGGS